MKKPSSIFHLPTSILAIVFSILVVTAATPVYFPVLLMTGATNDVVINVRAINNPVIYNGSLYYMPVNGTNITTVGGNVTNSFIVGGYTASIAGIPRSWRFYVTNSATPISVVNLMVGDGITVYNDGSPLGALTNGDTRNIVLQGSLTANNLAKLMHGNNALATGSSAHAEGVNTIASGDYSHAEGNSTVAGGAASHADGVGGVVTANWAYVWNGDNINPATNSTQGRFHVKAPGGIVLDGVITGNGLGLTNLSGGSGTFDFLALTNKPAPILLVSTNNGNTLTNIPGTSITGTLTNNTTGSASFVATAVTNQWLNDATNAALTISTNLNNSLYGFDSEALLYCNSRGISNLGNIIKINGMVRTLKLGGVWSKKVDLQILRSNLNSINLTNAITWNGKQHVVYGAAAPGYDETGVTFTDGASGALWITNLADMRTNTVVVQATINAATWNNVHSVFTLQNGDTSSSFGGSYQALGVLQNGNSGVQWRQGNGGAFTYGTYVDHHRLNGLGINGTRVSDYPRVYITAVSNLTWSGWLENIPAGPSTLTPILANAANSMSASGPMTNIVIGANLTGSSPPFQSAGCKVQAWFVFNSVLTQNEVDCVNRALRCLDPQKKNVVFYGDSRMAGESFDFAGAVGDQRGAFPNALMNRIGNQDSRFFNMSVPSISIDQQQDDTNFLRRVSFYAPDGFAVNETEVFVFPSAYNQFANVGSSTVLTTFNQASNLVSKIKKLGCKVSMFTEAPITTANYSTNSSGTSWTNFAAQYNILLVTNARLCDRLLRYDLAMSNTERLTNSGFYTDGIHATATGNTRWADFTAKQIGGEAAGFYSTRGGTTNITALTAITLSFQVPFQNTNYTVNAVGSAALAGVFVSSKTTSNCILNMTSFTGGIDWTATQQSQ